MKSKHEYISHTCDHDQLNIMPYLPRVEKPIKGQHPLLIQHAVELVPGYNFNLPMYTVSCKLQLN